MTQITFRSWGVFATVNNNNGVRCAWSICSKNWVTARHRTSAAAPGRTRLHQLSPVLPKFQISASIATVSLVHLRMNRRGFRYLYLENFSLRHVCTIFISGQFSLQSHPCPKSICRCTYSIFYLLAMMACFVNTRRLWEGFTPQWTRCNSERRMHPFTKNRFVLVIGSTIGCS